MYIIILNRNTLHLQVTVAKVQLPDAFEYTHFIMYGILHVCM